jgi:hypothetical protein
MGFFVLGGLVVVALCLAGLACIFWPARVQRAAKDAQRGSPWAGVVGRAFDSNAYLVVLRFIGAVSLAIGLVLGVVMVFGATGYFER